MMRVVLHGGAKIHSKYDNGCMLCPYTRYIAWQVSCDDIVVTKATVSGHGVTKDCHICDACIKECENSDEIKVTYER